MEKMIPKSLTELRSEISLLIEYGAPEENRATLGELLDKYAADLTTLNLFHNFYSFLPDAIEDRIIRISRVARRHGAFLLCVTTLFNNYLYLATHAEAVLLGPLTEGLVDQELLEFFGWQDNEHFKRKTSDPAELPDHLPVNESQELCPICGTGDGEVHAFGCPVEVCPWCEGQLTNCQCRFIKTGRDKFTQDSHLQELLALLEKKGRIPFAAGEHRPSFPSEDG